MKEYEYIVEALENYLCDKLAGVICSENYRNKSYEHGYRQLFAKYCKLHENFCSGKEIFEELLQEQNAKEKFKNQCEKNVRKCGLDFLTIFRHARMWV